MRSWLRPGVFLLVTAIAVAGCYEAADTAVKKSAAKSPASESKSAEVAKSDIKAASTDIGTGAKATAGEYALTVEGMT
jgi:hypothetical protein